MTTSEGKTEALRERLSSRIPAGGKDGPTQGVNHIAVFAKDLEATAKFYDEILDMPVIRVLYRETEHIRFQEVIGTIQEPLLPKVVQ